MYFAKIVTASIAAASALCAAFSATGASPELLDGKAFEVNGAFAAHLLTAKGGYPELGDSRSSATNRLSPVTSVPLELSFSNRISGALAAWLVTPSAPPPAVAVLRVAGGKAVDRLVLTAPVLDEIEIVNLGAQPQPVELRVRVGSLNVSVLGGTSKASIPVVEREPYTVRLVVDGKPVLPLAVNGIGMDRNSPGGTGSTKERITTACKDFAVTFHQADIGWLFDWYRSVVLSPAGAPAPRRVNVELVGTGKVKQVPLAALEGVVITSFDPLSDPAGIAVTAEFKCEQFTLLADAFK